MHARLGPQMPGMGGKPHVMTAQEACLGPSAAPAITYWLLHLPVQQPVGDLVNRGLLGSINNQLDDMLSTPFNPHIINYNLQGGFMVLKFSTYDGTKDPFDHIMHYKQLMTLDIGNDALLCKVFPASLQGQALSWFHRLPINSVNNFQELS